MSAWKALVTCRDTLRQDFTRLAWNISLGGCLSAPGQGIAIWKGSRSIWASWFFPFRFMRFLTGKMFENVFLRNHYWRFTWTFCSRAKFDAESIGCTLGGHGTSETSISGVRGKLQFTSKLTSLEKSREELENGDQLFLVIFVVLFCGKLAEEIRVPYGLQIAWNLPKICSW